MTGTSSANPEELRTYTSRVIGPLNDAEEALPLLAAAIVDLNAALPAGYSLTHDVDLTVPFMGRAKGLDTYVSHTATVFEEAGAGDGTVTVDDSLLPTLPTTYDADTMSAIEQRLADELASLKERRGDDADPTTLGELVALLDAARALTDSADGTGTDTGLDVAERLTAGMGPGDVEVMLAMLETGLADDQFGATSVRGALDDLGTLVSRGLERQPGRAERWVDTLTEGHDWYHHGPPERLIALGASVAPETSTVGLAVWGALWNHTYTPTAQGTVATHQHRAAEGGVLDQLYGTGNAIEVMASAAADRPTLANGIVMHTIAEGPDGFEHLLAQGGAQNPSLGDDSTYAELGSMLAASVHPSLPLDDRLLAASQTMTMFDHVRAEGPHYYYAGPVLEGIGTMTQPLLANLDAEGRYILLPGADPLDPAANQSADRLWATVRDLGNSEAGSRGVGVAVDGATVELIDQARRDAIANGDVEPLHESTLNRAGQMMSQVVERVASERYGALVDAVEGGGIDAALQEGLLGAIGATPYEPIAVIADTVLAYEGQEVVQGGGVLGPNPEARLTHTLVLANLSARPELASDELVAGLQQAAATNGASGIYNFIEGAPFTDQQYPGLGALRELVNDQQEAVGADAPALLDRVFGVG